MPASRNPFLATLLPRLWPAGRPDLRRRVVIALLFLVAAKLFNVVVPYLFKRAVDLLDTGLSAGDIAVGAVLMFVLAYGIARIGAQAFGELRDAVFAKVAQAAIRDLALQVFDHLHADRKSTRLNSSHVKISYAVFC